MPYPVCTRLGYTPHFLSERSQETAGSLPLGRGGGGHKGPTGLFFSVLLFEYMIEVHVKPLQAVERQVWEAVSLTSP